MSNTPSNNFWVLLEVLARRRGLIITLVLLATVVAAVVSMLLPQWYTSRGLLLPPPDNSPSDALSQLSQVGLLESNTRLPGMITLNDVYARILRSHRLSDRIIERFNLAERFGESRKMPLYDLLGQRTGVRVTDEGLLEVSFEDKDPKMAAAIATGYIEELIEVNKEIVSAAAIQKREFIEARLEDVAGSLHQARDDLERFQLDNKTIDLDQQTRLAMEQATSLKVAQANLELEMAIDRQTLKADHPQLIAKQNRYNAIEEQLQGIEQGTTDSSFFSVPLSAMPALRGQYEELLSRVRVNESLHRRLLELLEEARIQEQETAPDLAVLDWPTVPDLRSRPQRRIIVMGTFGVALILSVLLAAFLEYVRRLRESSSEDYLRLIMFADAFLGWLPGVRVKKPDH